MKTIALTLFCIVLNVLACSVAPPRRESPVLFEQVCLANRAALADPKNDGAQYTLLAARAEYGRVTGRRFAYADLKHCAGAMP